MRRTTVAATVVTTALVLGTTVLAPPAGSTAAETCRGRAATITAGAGGITGTEGSDVVVVDASIRNFRVSLLGGDDVVCVRGEAPRAPIGASVEAGPGDDVVDTTGTRRAVEIYLGDGSDRFEGGPGRDSVAAGDWVEGGHADTEADVVLAGGGEDRIDSGSSGQPNADVLDLGPGPDIVRYEGTGSPEGAVTGGLGDDVLLPEVTGTSVTLDNAAGRLLDDGRVTASWTSFEDFQVSSPAGAPPVHVTFVGSDADEGLSVLAERVRLTAHFGRGDDDLNTYQYIPYRGGYGEPPMEGSVIDAGPGRDLLDVAAFTPGTVAVDLRSGRLRIPGAASHVVAVRGFEDAIVVGSRVELSGTSRANGLRAKACAGLVDGRGGRDTVRAFQRAWASPSSCGRRGFRLSGGAGADDLAGTHRDDRLVGGSGRDSARGGAGRDRCTAEARTGCERS